MTCSLILLWLSNLKTSSNVSSSMCRLSSSEHMYMYFRRRIPNVRHDSVINACRYILQKLTRNFLHCTHQYRQQILTSNCCSVRNGQKVVCCGQSINFWVPWAVGTVFSDFLNFCRVLKTGKEARRGPRLPPPLPRKKN